MMTALERIKQLQKQFDEPHVIHAIGHPDVMFSMVYDENKFLLKAFKVIREIANDYSDACGGDAANVDEEFEKRMKDAG